VPTFTAFATVGLLEQFFSDFVDYSFTARMEDDLDRIASGEAEAIPWLSRFYFGNGHPGLKEMVSDRLEEIDAREVNSIPLGMDDAGTPVVARAGRYGPYVQRGEDTASIPDDMAPDELTVERAVELLSAPSSDRTLGTDPDTGLPVLLRSGRFGPYVQLGEAGESKDKPRTASLFKTMTPEETTLDEALRLLTLPRTVGTDPDSGDEIVALNGRYGPYVKKGKDTRSLETEEQLFTVTMDDAEELFARPKARGRKAAAALRDLGEDPVTGSQVQVKSGRYGPYVTDGETNASLRKSDTPEEITLERAAELLQERRAAGPSKRKGRSRS
jgi:DNA topoisomerase I